MVGDGLNTAAVWNDFTFLLGFVVFRLDQWGEAELSGDENLLSAWELELGSSEGLLGMWNIIGSGSAGHENLTDGHSCGLAESLTEGTSHSLLESIGSSTREHLVDSNDVPWMDSDSAMESLSSDLGHHVLVASNSCCLKCL